MSRALFALVVWAATGLAAFGQFAPQVGIPGCDAIAASSPDILSWATKCRVTRGSRIITQPDSGLVTSGDSSLALGMADNYVVSLGDSGAAVLSFAAPISDGPGPDFAVFENGFANPLNAEEAYLELAFVEVSSDGDNFFRFPATSLSDTLSQVPGVGAYMNARYINNLAGKYVASYGTPFDLSDLPDHPLLNKQAIMYVRLVDVVGDIGAYGSRDAGGKKVVDPFPTPFPTGGFDLDAVAVLHQQQTHVAGNQGLAPATIALSPNPVADLLTIQTAPDIAIQTIMIKDMSGRRLLQQTGADIRTVDVSGLPDGLFTISVLTDRNEECTLRFAHF